jgi:RNA polymerase sigma-70 factor (ECF subfamily)
MKQVATAAMNTSRIDDSSQTAAFRPKLLAIAYRMLGSVADSEDAVQDAYLRFQSAQNVESPEAWLVKTTTRLCIDRLRRNKRRAEYVGPWLPEPVTNDWDGAAPSRMELTESLSMAFLVLLETLTPAERAAYVLRSVFGYEFDEIAALLDKSSANIRQLTARARKRLDLNERRFEADADEADALAERFFLACKSGDLNEIESFLARDVVMYSDGGGKVFAAPRPIVGPRRVAKLLAVVFKKMQRVGEISLETVNNRPAAVVTVQGHTVEIFSFGTSGSMIDALYAVINPDKLRHWNKDAASDVGDLTWPSLFKGEE